MPHLAPRSWVPAAPEARVQTLAAQTASLTSAEIATRLLLDGIGGVGQ